MKLNQTLKHLDEVAGRAADGLSDLQEAAIERWLQLAIQICMDLGDRALAARNIEEPPRAREIFRALQGHGVLTAEQARGMEKLVDLRNALVHDYGEFSPATTPGAVSNALPLLQAVGNTLVEVLSS